MNATKTASADTQNQKFITYDIALAAALITLGYKLLNIEKIAERRSQFILSHDDHTDKMVNDYWSDQLILPVRSFYDNLKMIKNRLYSEIE
jgi:hypothetical protein